MKHNAASGAARGHAHQGARGRGAVSTNRDDVPKLNLGTHVISHPDPAHLLNDTKK